MTTINSCVFALLCSMAAYAQAPAAVSRPPIPITISSIEKTLTPNHQALFKIDLANPTANNVMALVFRVNTLDNAGTALGNSCELMMQVGNRTWPSDKPIHAEVRSQYIEKDGKTFQYVPTVDYVFFSNGTGAGPDVCGKSEQIRTMWIATDAERRRLLKLRDAEGSQAVSQDLDRKK